MTHAKAATGHRWFVNSIDDKKPPDSFDEIFRGCDSKKPFVNPISTLMKILRMHPSRADELLRTSDCGFVSGDVDSAGSGSGGISRVESIRRCLENNAEALKDEKLKADYSQTIVDEVNVDEKKLK